MANSIQFLDLEGLRYYNEKIKQYIDMRIGMEVHGKTNCPNCGAIITNTDNCEYCGTIIKNWMCER